MRIRRGISGAERSRSDGCSPPYRPARRGSRIPTARAIVWLPSHDVPSLDYGIFRRKRFPGILIICGWFDAPNPSSFDWPGQEATREEVLLMDVKKGIFTPTFNAVALQIEGAGRARRTSAGPHRGPESLATPRTRHRRRSDPLHSLTAAAGTLAPPTGQATPS